MLWPPHRCPYSLNTCSVAAAQDDAVFVYACMVAHKQTHLSTQHTWHGTAVLSVLQRGPQCLTLGTEPAIVCVVSCGSTKAYYVLHVQAQLVYWVQLALT